MTLKVIGNIQHGEKYQKDGQDKWKNTDLGTLFKDDETGDYVVKYLGQWCKVWPPKMKEEGYQEAKQAVQSHDGGMDDDVPFSKIPNEVL